MFALIIGINDYQRKEDSSSLRGAVPDGKAFRDYLMTRLRVPKDQISTLFDEQATRSAIIEAFEDLSENCHINKGDPIFIFYAGHGSQQRPHPDWKEPNAKIEVIIPYNCNTLDRIPAPGSVPAIPDRTIGALIDEIARKKGDNIVGGFECPLEPVLIQIKTVVFDCCNSASGTRSGGHTTLVRSVSLGNLEFDRDTDRNIWDSRSRGARPHDGHSHRGLKSHILISACSSFEEAVEDEGHGRLSMALLKLLHKVSPDELRNCDILANIEPIPQFVPRSPYRNLLPQADGLYLYPDRVLNAKVMPKLDFFLMARSHSLEDFIRYKSKRTPRSIRWLPAMLKE